MWFTNSVIILICLYITYIFHRNRYFYLHSFFLIPLYPAIYFIDHNAYMVIKGLDVDSVYPVVKLIPLYLNIFYLALRFKYNKLAGLSFVVVAVNSYFIYNLMLSLVYSVYYSSMLPVFYMSYSTPLFFLYFNSANLFDELDEIKQFGSLDNKMLNAYLIGFIMIYALGIYYSLKSGITTTLLNSRSIGSIYASTSALMYCLLYAPLLSVVNGKKWPHVLTIIIGITSLSKTALLMLPAYFLLLLAKIRSHLVKYIPRILFVIIIVVALMPMLASTPLGEYWQTKFALDSGQSLLAKSYLSRSEIHDSALKTIREFPFGIGVGNFEKYNAEGYRDSHNFMINVVVESGLIFGSLLALTIIICFVRSLKAFLSGYFKFNHFSIVCVFAVYITASGVLQTTGTSEFNPIYYTPFYGVAVFQLLSLTCCYKANRD